MVKVKQTASNELRQLETECPDFKNDEKILFCKKKKKVCNNPASAEVIFTGEQHL